MSVRLTSTDGFIDDQICNGDWAAVIAVAQAYGEKIPGWAGTHDDHKWTPEQLTVMADRLEQVSRLVEPLRDYIKAGGLVQS